MKLSRTLFIPCFVIFTAILLLAGCSTGKRFVKTEGASSDTATDLGLSVKLRYIDEEEIKEKYGKRNNPFLSPPSALSPNPFIIFELTMDTDQNFKGPFTVHLKDVEIQFGGINKQPTNQFLLTKFWEHELQQEMLDKRYVGWSMGKIRVLIKRTIFPNKFEIQRGDTQKGLLFFKGGFPRYGEAFVYVPVIKDGAMAKNFRFTFEFGFTE